MQKKLLATVVASLVAGQAMAVEIYNDDTTSLSIGGRMGVLAEKTHGNKVDTGNDSSRINFKFAHQFDNGWTGEAAAEWGFSSLSEGGSNAQDFTNRLGFVGLKNDEVGSFVLGKNWSVAYDVNSYTDAMAIRTSSSLATYDGRVSGDFDGSSRADDALQYRTSFGGLNVGVQYQFADADRSKGESVAVSYDLPMGLSVGATYSETKYDLDVNERSRARTVAVKFANEDLTVAAAFGKFNNKVTMIDSHAAETSRLADKSKGFEVFGQYELGMLVDGLAIQSSFERRIADQDKSEGDVSNAKHKTFALAPVYTTGPMQFAFEWKRDHETGFKGKKEQDDTYSVQARYYF